MTVRRRLGDFRNHMKPTLYLRQEPTPHGPQIAAYIDGTELPFHVWHWYDNFHPSVRNPKKHCFVDGTRYDILWLPPLVLRVPEEPVEGGHAEGPVAA